MAPHMKPRELDYVIEKLKGSEVSLAEIGKATKISPRTLLYVRERKKNTRYTTIVKLLEYFSK